MELKDTIVAAATAMTNSGIGIIRISGEEAFSIADEIFQSKNGKEKKEKLADYDGYTMHYGYIVDKEQMVDEVILSIMKSPNSYTTENTVEINCHGGVFVMQRIIELAINHGARPAEPGEFTKRAFLNGRIDLAEAEAVMDIIQAKNEFALSTSMKQLHGWISKNIKRIRENLLNHIAYIEAALDDPEHINMDSYGEELLHAIEPIEQELEKMIQSADDGRIRAEGIQTVILGKPNAGKSSLLNLLSGENRAIVTDIAGTTRDTLEETISMRGITLNIVDTAGIRNTEDTIEQIGVDRAKKYANEADFIIYIVDATQPLDENDKEIIKLIQNKKAVVLKNKIDLENVIEVEQLEKLTGKQVLPVSIKENKGIEKLEEVIEKLFCLGEITFNDQLYITNIRHKAAMEEAYQSLQMVKKSIEDQMPEDFFTIDLMSAYTELGKIIGEEVEDDLVNQIFSKFCMGK